MVFGLQLFSRGGSSQENKATVQVVEPDAVTSAMGSKTELATFGAGCFWSVELAYQRVPGVVKVRLQLGRWRAASALPRWHFCPTHEL